MRLTRKQQAAIDEATRCGTIRCHYCWREMPYPEEGTIDKDGEGECLRGDVCNEARRARPEFFDMVKSSFKKGKRKAVIDGRLR
jgi:hypothetical protein